MTTSYLVVRRRELFKTPLRRLKEVCVDWEPNKEPTACEKSYAKVGSGANNAKYDNHIISRNTNKTNMVNESQSILGKLETQHLRKLQQRHCKLPSRSNWKDEQKFTSNEEQIEQLKSELEQLKQSKNHQFSDKRNYKILESDPTLQHNEMVSDTFYLVENEDLLSEKTAEVLKIIKPKTPKLFNSLKIQK